METYQRICIADYEKTDSTGNRFEITRGNEYITSNVDVDGKVMVFSNYWVRVPVVYFAGEKPFTINKAGES